MLAAKAIAYTEALEPSFATYAQRLWSMPKPFAQACIDEGIMFATGGTDNHLMLLDVRSFGLNGRRRGCFEGLRYNTQPQLAPL